MAGRVNTWFVVALIVAVVALVGAVGGLYFLRTDPTKLVQRGDELLAQGLTEKALEQYGKALSRQVNDMALMLKYVHALTQVKTSDPRTARGYVGNMIGTLRRAITQEPHNTVPFEKLMQIYMRLGHDLGDFESWNRMYEDADTRLKSNPGAHGTALGKKFRGIARVNRMERLDMTADEREEARQDLVDAMAQLPDDRDVRYYLAAWHVLQARVMQRLPGHQDEAEQHLEQAEAISAESLVAYPDDTRRQLDRLRVLSLVQGTGGGGGDEVMRLLEEVEQRLLHRPSSLRLVLELVELLTQIDRKKVKSPGEGSLPRVSGLVRAEGVLNSAIAANPDEPRYLATLGRVLEAMGRYDEAIAQFKLVCQLQPQTNAFEGVQLERLRVGATTRYVSLSLRRIDSVSQAQRQEVIEEAESLMRQVVANHGESPEINLVLGKIAMARGKWGEASAKLDRANTQFGSTVPEALWLSAKAWMQMRELGAAADRLEQLVKIRPGSVSARQELANLYLELDKVDEAADQLAVILQKKPDDRTALKLKAKMLTQKGQIEQAIDVYLSLDPKEDPKIIPPLAGLYVTLGDTEVATQLLEQRFAQAPTDLQVLQELVRISSNTQQARAYVKTARDAGGDTQVLSILESQLEGQADLTKVLEGLIESDEVPFRRHIKRYQLFSRLGNRQQAVEELAHAARIRADHPVVISAQFDQALLDRDWSEGQSIVDRASALNIDLAQGAFYAGRLEAHRGQYDQAIASFRRGLSLRPIYSEGWRQLGDVQRLMLAWRDAAMSYERSLEQRPNNVMALRGLAVVQNALGKHDQAKESLRKASRFSPGNRALREQYLAIEQEHGDIQVALKRRQRIAQDQPDDTDNRRSLAVLLAKVGRFTEAQEVMDRLIEQTGRDRFNARAAAEIKHIAGDLDAAQTILQDYVHGLGNQATDEDWMMLARYLVGVGNDDVALAAYRQAVAVEDAKLRRATREFADLLFERGMYAEAVDQYGRLWESAADDKRVGHRYVEALLRVNDPEKAQEVLAVVTSKHGTDAGTMVLEALIARSRGNTDAALVALDRAVELDPLRAITYYQRADTRASVPGQEVVVMQDLERALELDPDLSAARRLLATLHVRRGERNEAIRQLRTLIRRRPRHIAARLQLAGLYLEAQQWDQRRPLLEESAKLYPKAPVWLQLRAQQALLDKNLGLAIEKLEQAYALVRSPQILGELSALLLRFGKPDQALSLLRSEAEIARGVPWLHALRGRALVDLGDSDLAGRAFSRAVEQSASFADLTAVALEMSHGLGWDQTVSQLELLATGANAGLVELAIVQIEAEIKRYDAAMERLERIDALVAEGSPERAQYDRLLALVFYQRRQYEESLAVYQRLLQRQPNNLITLNNTAYLLAEDLGRAEDAVPLAQRAADLAPDNPLVLDTLGWSLFKSGRHDAAYQVLTRSVRVKPSALNCLHLAEVLRAKGDTRAATENLEQAKVLAAQAEDQQTLWIIDKRLDELVGSSKP